MSCDVQTNIGLDVGRDTEIKFVVSKNFPENITLTIGDSLAEITFTSSMVEELRDKADEAVRRLKEMCPQ